MKYSSSSSSHGIEPETNREALGSEMYSNRLSTYNDTMVVSEITHSFTTPYSLYSEFNIVDYIVDSTAERLGHARTLLRSLLGAVNYVTAVAQIKRDVNTTSSGGVMCLSLN